MGNTCKSMGLCCCFIPNKYQFEDEVQLKQIKKNSKLRKLTKSKDIFTIYNNEFDRASSSTDKSYDCEYFKSSIKSLTDHRLTSDLADMNLTKISHQMTSFNNSNLIDIDIDSGFNSRSISPSCYLDSISLESDYLSDFSMENTPNKQASSITKYGYSLMYTSISNVPFVLKNSLNQSIDGIKKSVFNSRFISFVKTKILNKDLNNSLINKELTKSICSINVVEETKSSEKIHLKQQKSNSSIFYNTGINSLRQVLLRIYDVNYF